MKKFIISIAISLISMYSFSQWTQFVWDTITFEEPYEFLVIDTSIQNLWQIGEPDKIFFDSAFSSPNAIITDTMYYYPVNNTSHFYLKIGNFNYNGWYPYDIFIEIKHKYDTDTLKDGGYITVSYDYGITWMNIIKDTVYDFDVTPAQENEYLYTENDTLFNGEFGFSGNSGGWVTTMFTWHLIPVDALNEIGDTMLIGFNLISDSIDTSKEGWMIDNIKLYSVDLGGGISKHSISQLKIFPNPTQNRLSVLYENKPYSGEVNIYNQSGQIVMNTTMVDNSITVSGLQSGLYIVGIMTEKGEIRRKFIIRH